MNYYELLQRAITARDELVKLSKEAGVDFYINAHPDGTCMAVCGDYASFIMEDGAHLMERSTFTEVSWDAVRAMVNS